MKNSNVEHLTWVTTEFAHQGGARKRYLGARTERGAIVLVHQGRRVYELSPRFDLRNHSPTGFEWGYQGSGPAQLSLAILADALGDDARAIRHYQSFKRCIVAPLKGNAFLITEEMIEEFLSVAECDVNAGESIPLFDR